MTFQFLSEQQVNQFYRDGYLKVPGFLKEGQVEQLFQRSKQLLEEFDPEGSLTKFTLSRRDHVGNEYFLTSGDKIHYFLEENAVDDDGRLLKEKAKAVNKIGHGLHIKDPVFREVTMENESLKSLVRDLSFHHDPVALQSMLIFKQPEIGGAVPEHNDSTFLYTTPPTALGFWLALERCTPTNGALSFLPGSHFSTPITERLVRLPGGGTGFEPLPAPVLTRPRTAETSTTASEYKLETCEPGDLVLIHGSVLHKSERNTSSETRYAYTFHMIDSQPYAEYDNKNWLQPTSLTPFPKVLEKPIEQTHLLAVY